MKFFPASLMLAALLCLSTAFSGPSAQAELMQPGEPARDAGLRLTGESPDGVRLHFGLDRFGLEPIAIDGTTAHAVSLPGVLLPNDAGFPDLAGLGRYLAVPQGATAKLTVVSARSELYKEIDVAPAPEIPRGDDDAPLVFRRDPAAYARDAFYPEAPVRLSEPMVMRGVDVVIAGITPFQYNPVTRELIVYTELDVRVDFIGGNGHFGEERLRSRHWEPILQGQILNYASLPPLPESGAPGDGRDGCEYVIISPTDAGFVAWATQLRDWRRLQGISAEVFTTAQTGTTATQIESWLNNAYNTWAVPPAAFVILADYPSSGDGYRDTAITAPIYNSYCVSDNIYADVNGDQLPDMAHARICARSATELGSMLTKMFDYEQAPYTDPSFYDRPVIAGGWQTERWFILCTEVAYGFQANVLGKHPVREYAIYSGTPGTVWSTATNTSTVVNYFGPNGLGYIPSTPQHLTDWGGSATRINNDLNAGAYMLLHRDHGYELGWGEPSYSTSSLNGLSNARYPFVFSINCLTGKYNYSAETFTEKFHRMAGGALGLVAASEVSYSFVNDAFVWGMLDGMWPDFMPTYGPYPHGPDPLRPCFGMCYGKYFLQASNWPYNTSSKTVTYHLFHHHGDAFLRMTSEVPQALTVIHDGLLPLGATSYTVQANAGALIGLTVDGQIIGTAEATGAAQTIPIIAQAQPGTMVLTVTAPNYFRHVEDVPIQGGTLPLTAAFSGTPTSGSAPLAVDFADASTGEITSWSWTFGDGGTSTAPSPSHLYNAPDIYTVSLTVTGPSGSHTETKTDYITVTEPTAQWITITYDDFESGMGSYTDGGADMSRYTRRTYAHQGSCAADIQDNSGVASSFYHTLGHNVTGYTALEVDFWFRAVSMETNEDFWVQYFDGTTWRTVATYASGRDFSNNVFYHKVVSIPTSYAYPTNAKLRFMCDASADNDDVYIDEIVFRGYGTARAAGEDAGAIARLAPGGETTSEDDLETEESAVRVWSLERGLPNPFSGSTLLRFTLPAPAHATLEVFDVGGRRVATLVDGRLPAGPHGVQWNAAQQDAGFYFARLRADGRSEVTRLVVVR